MIEMTTTAIALPAPERMSMALNHAITDYQVQLQRRRLGAPDSVGLDGGGLDAKRPQAWCEYGFPAQVTFPMLYWLYRRGGVAYGGVNKLVGKCWQTNPWLIEGEKSQRAKKLTAWEKTLPAVFDGGRFWKAFEIADTYRLVGRYSALILRFKDSKKLSEPVQGTAVLHKMVPVWGAAIKVKATITDADDENFGEPQMYEFTRESPSRPGESEIIDVHASRVFILGDMRASAIGFLEPAFNAFVSMEKVEGGAGESFLKNAARHLAIDFDKSINLAQIASMYGVTLPELQQKFQEAAKAINNSIDSVLVTQGATTTALTSTVSDPAPTYGVNLQTASAALDIPSRILVGNQSGERSSKEDNEYFNNRCQSRRLRELSFEIHSLIVRLMQVGHIKPIALFTVMWDDLTTKSLEDRLASADKMATVNQKEQASGEAVFTQDEIREVSGYDPKSPTTPLPEGADDGDDEDDVEDAAP